MSIIIRDDEIKKEEKIIISTLYSNDKEAMLEVHISFRYFRISCLVYCNHQSYKIIKYKDIYIVDIWKYIDEDDYPPKNGEKDKLSINFNIVSRYFELIDAVYGIKLNKISFHNWQFIECNNYVFSNKEKQNNLEERIKKACLEQV